MALRYPPLALRSFPPAMNSPSPALSILASPSSATSVDPDIWVEDAVGRRDAAPLLRTEE